jgi:cation transport protein ChaC
MNNMSRAGLMSGALQVALRREGEAYAWSGEKIEQSLAATLALVESKEVWVFAYGSLVWNPTFKVAESRRALVHGYHRSFCLNLPLGRGTPERPGLMLGLDRGGSCVGLALKVGGDVDMELALLWQREMLAGFYLPRWTHAHTSEGPVMALTFVADPTGPHYLGRLPEAEIARIIGGASGWLGSNREYLERTVDGLAAAGAPDRRMSRILQLLG